MKYGTSLRVRHLVGRFDKGEQFIDALRRLCSRERVRSGTFQAIGVLSSVELQEFVAGQYVTRFNAETNLDILSLTGNISTLGNEVIVNASAMLAYSSYGQRHIIGGHVAQARIYVCEFSLTGYDDLVLERTYDAATGLPLWNRIGGVELADMAEPSTRAASPSGPVSSSSGPVTAEEAEASALSEAPAAEEVAAEPEQTSLEAVGVHVATSTREPTVIRRRSSKPKEEPAADVSEASEPARPTPASKDEWQDAVRKVQVAEARSKLKIPEGGSKSSSKNSFDDDFEDEVMVSAGDVLLHPTLGRCRVARVEDEDWAFIRVGGTGKLRKLALHLFDLVPQEPDEDGRDVYKMKKRRAR